MLGWIVADILRLVSPERAGFVARGTAPTSCWPRRRRPPDTREVLATSLRGQFWERSQFAWHCRPVETLPEERRRVRVLLILYAL
jgi:hypothetical protein